MITMNELDYVCGFGSDTEWKKVIDDLVANVPEDKVDIVVRNVESLKSIWDACYNLRLDNLIRALKKVA